ncbi:BnaA08g12590D [Brassica napus]|uniref:BnaA08g12590D protein n=1 Tax=Brassica napus TaxID=3708 RepID=A0A078GDY7_BRANA|nr:BnaA08g12590D [Brassica napus]
MDLDGIISTKQTVNYESKTRAVHSNTPVSFSIRVREVELRFVRDGSVLRENLLKHRTIASPVIGLEIPPCFLAEVMLLRPCLRQSYPPGFNRSSFLKSAKTPLRRRAKEVVLKYQPNQIVQSAYKILVLGASSPSCAAATTIFTGIVFSRGWAASLHVLLVILSKIRSLLSRHNDEQPLNITGQLIFRGQNGYFQSGQVKDRVTYVAHHTPFQAAEGFCYIYMGVSLARSYREVSGKTEYFHELVTEPAQLLEVLSEDLPVRCVMVLHEDEAIPTWIHKKARTRLVCVTRTRVTTKKVSNHVITSL